MFGLCGGIAVGVLGSIVSVVAWFTGPEWHGHLLQRDGTVLLVLTIPLLAFGAHCLDLVDRQKIKKQRSRFVLIAFLLFSGAGAADAQETVSERERLLFERIERLERRLEALEAGISSTRTDAAPKIDPPQIAPAAGREGYDFLRDTTFGSNTGATFPINHSSSPNNREF